MTKFWTSSYASIGYMMLATSAFVINDTFLKLGATNLPSFETLFIRAGFSVLWCIPLLLFTKTVRQFGQVLNKRVLLRNFADFVSSILFLIAIVNLPIADLSALVMISPVLLVVAAAVFFKEHVSTMQWVLVLTGFVGALLIAQPGASGFSPYTLLAFVVAIVISLRDLLGRQVPAHIPGPIIAVGAMLTMAIGAGLATLLWEEWRVPALSGLIYLGAAGFFLMFANLFVFLAFRSGNVSVTAPFFYASMVWAFLSGLLVFGTMPNGLGLVGMILIFCSGVAIALMERRQRRKSDLAEALL